MQQRSTDCAGPMSSDLEGQLFETRRLSRELAAPLSAEDMTVQAMEDASPTKWHLAHVTWFFETFILVAHLPGYRVFDDTFGYCFNSYYENLRRQRLRVSMRVRRRLPDLMNQMPPAGGIYVDGRWSGKASARKSASAAVPQAVGAGGHDRKIGARQPRHWRVGHRQGGIDERSRGPRLRRGGQRRRVRVSSSPRACRTAFSENS